MNDEVMGRNVIGNKIMNDEKPWEKGKDGWKILLELHYLLSVVTALYEPVITGKIEEFKSALKNNKKVILFEKLKLSNI